MTGSFCYLFEGLFTVYIPTATIIPAIMYFTEKASPRMMQEKITPRIGISELKIAILLTGL